MEVKSQELKVLFRKIPAVMHGRTKQALRRDNIKQPADDSLLYGFDSVKGVPRC